MPWLWRLFDRSIKARIFGGATQPKYKSFSMPQSCHDSDLEINFLTEISPHEVSWDEHRSDAESVKILYNYPLNFQNMQSVSMPVQVFWNLELIPIKGNWFSSKHFFAVFAIVLCVSGADLYFEGGYVSAIAKYSRTLSYASLGI